MCDYFDSRYFDPNGFETDWGAAAIVWKQARDEDDAEWRLFLQDKENEMRRPA